MFVKSSTITALLASALLVLASPIEVKRDGTGSVNVANNTPNEIEYALVGESGTVSQGSIAAGATVNLPMSPSDQGYSCKLTTQGNDPMSSSNILQFEYTYSADQGNSVFFDWSCVNCNPDPFSQYVRTIQPSQPSSSCVALTCNAGQDDSSCEFTDSMTGPVNACPDFDGVVLTATIG